MKKVIAAASLLLALLAGAISFSPLCAAQEASSSVSPAVVPFTLIIVGTRHYSDVDVMRRNVARIPAMQRLVPTVSSQKHLQFAGVFGGSEESLLSDIEGLASDRFEVKTRQDKTRGLVITLRKIMDDAQ